MGGCEFLADHPNLPAWPRDWFDRSALACFGSGSAGLGDTPKAWRAYIESLGIQITAQADNDFITFLRVLTGTANDPSRRLGKLAHGQRLARQTTSIGVTPTPTSARKSTLSPDYIAAICYLLAHGEKRLLAAVERGVMPAGIGMEIALPVSRSSFHGQLTWINESFSGLMFFKVWGCLALAR